MTDETVRTLLEYCLEKPGAYIDFPFGEVPVCVKVGGRLFAQVYPKEGDRKITLNCDAMTGEFLRSMHPEAVVRGYHCPPRLQPYFNTIYVNAVPDAEIRLMIDHSYSYVVKKLPKKAQKELAFQ